MNLAGLGSFLAPAELVEQQVIGGHDGGGSVGGERVHDLRQRVAQRLRHVRQHGRVEILRTQPGKQRERKRERERDGKKERIVRGSLRILLVRNDQETVQLWFDDFFNPGEETELEQFVLHSCGFSAKGIIARRSHT